MDFVFKISKGYYLQVFLEEYKYIAKGKKMSKFINAELEISSDEEASEKEWVKTKYHDRVFKKNNFHGN